MIFNIESIYLYFKVELALGEFPYKNGNSILGQLVAIIMNDSPKLSRDKFSRELCDFVDSWYVS